MRRRAGQTTTEYVLLMSVISIAVVATMLAFSDTVQINARSLSSHLATELTGDYTGDQVQP